MKYVTTLIFCLFSFFVFSQDSSAIQDKKAVYFSKKRLLPFREFDPTEASIYLHSGVISRNERIDYDVYIPFGFGFYKNIVTWGQQEIALSGGMHTQFGVRQEHQEQFSGLRKSYLNSDFFIDLSYTRKVHERLTLGASFAHRSTHLGDDYILLYKITTHDYWSKDPTNYEWLSVSAHHRFKSIKCYERMGYVTRRNLPREKWELQAGMSVSNIQANHWDRLIAGIDVRCLQNTRFHPNLNMGIGMKVRRNFDLMLLYYNGFLPYSRYEVDTKIQWLGLGVRFRLVEE